MNSKEHSIGQGRPKKHTDVELKELALNIKYKFKGKKNNPYTFRKRNWYW